MREEWEDATYSSAFQVGFVTDYDKREIFGISGRGLYEKFVSPRI